MKKLSLFIVSARTKRSKSFRGEVKLISSCRNYEHRYSEYAVYTVFHHQHGDVHDDQMIRVFLFVILGGVLKHVCLVVVVVVIVVGLVVVVVVSGSLVFIVPEGQFGLQTVVNTANPQNKITKKHEYI